MPILPLPNAGSASLECNRLRWAPAPRLLRVALGKGPVYSVVHITSKFQPLKYNPFGHSYITTLFIFPPYPFFC